MDQFMVNSFLCHQIAQQHMNDHMEAVRIASDDFNRFMDESVKNHQIMMETAPVVETEEDPEFMKKFKETEAYIERIRRQIEEDKRKMGLL